MDALALGAEEGRDKRRNALGAVSGDDPGISEWGNPTGTCYLISVKDVRRKTQ